MPWPRSDILQAEAINQLRTANWFTQIVNTEKKSDREALAGRPPELIRPPGAEAPGPKRKPRRGPPLSIEQIRRFGGDVTEGG